MTVTVFGYLILISIFLRFYFSVFSLVLVSIEKIYQTLKTVFDHISKHLEACHKFFLVFGNVVKHGLSCLVYYIPSHLNHHFKKLKMQLNSQLSVKICLDNLKKAATIVEAVMKLQ